MGFPRARRAPAVQTMMLRQHALHHVQKMQLRHYCVPCASGFKADSRGIHIQFIIKSHRIRTAPDIQYIPVIILERCGSPYLGIQWFHMEYEPRSIRAEDVSTASYQSLALADQRKRKC